MFLRQCFDRIFQRWGRLPLFSKYHKLYMCFNIRCICIRMALGQKSTAKKNNPPEARVSVNYRWQQGEPHDIPMTIFLARAKSVVHMQMSC